jgi:N4-gp56 family major capsid protein
MAIEPEIWKSTVEENLFPNNEFYQVAIDDSPFLVGNKTIHIPQAGAKPNVEKNRTQLPANVQFRDDSDVTYNIDEFTTDPIVLQYTEEIERSYNKRQSILRNHTNTLNQEIADNFAYLWSPTKSEFIIRTSGTARTAYRGTGQRLAVTKDDIIELRRLLNRQEVPMNNRYLLIPADLEADILSIPDFMDADKYGSSNIADGAIGRIYGFDVFIRSVGLVYDNSATPKRKDPGSAAGDNDNLGILAYQADKVAKAEGTIQVFEDEQSPQYYGDVFSALVRSGGRKLREDEKGVVALVEQHN